MKYVSPSTWGSVPRPPSNESDDFMAAPTRETSYYARRTIPAAATAYYGDCGDGVAAMEIPLDGVEPFRYARIVSDDGGNKNCIRPEGRGVFEIPPSRNHGVEGEQ